MSTGQDNVTKVALLGSGKRRKVGQFGCGFAAICVALIAGIVMLEDDDATQLAEPRAGSVVSTKVDERLLPILNFDIELSAVNGAALPAVAEALAKAGRTLHAEGKLDRVTAANVMVRTADGAPALHFTVPVATMKQVVVDERPALLFLAQAQEGGGNTSDGRRAIRDYCDASTLGICQ